MDVDRAKSTRLKWGGIAAAIAIILVLLSLSSPERHGDEVRLSPAAKSPEIGPSPSAVSTAPSPPAPPFAERILDHYADPVRPPEDDLHAIARTLGNFMLLVKGENPIPLGANEEIADALRGRNKAALRALPDEHRAFNAQGQLVDRWGTPLYFHAESRDRLDVRSAGPDRKMWTADDLHRKPDGRFLRGAALLAPSLYNEKPATR